MKINKPTIYLDMDGVLADFVAGAAPYLGNKAKDYFDAAAYGQYPDAAWAILSQVPDLFRYLPKMQHADEMMTLAKRFRNELNWKLCILTAVPNDDTIPDSFQDKMDWINHYYPGVRVNFGPYSNDKQNHARPGDILVDDRKLNIEQWRCRSGVGVYVTRDYGAALAELQAIFDQLVGAWSGSERGREATNR